MKKTVSLITVTFLFVIWFAPSSAAQTGRDNRDRVCFYQDIHFRGWEQCYQAGDEVTDLRQLKNAISSIRIYGRVRITVYDETEFRRQFRRVQFGCARSACETCRAHGPGAIASNPSALPEVSGHCRSADAERKRYDRRDDRRDGICVYEMRTPEAAPSVLVSGKTSVTSRGFAAGTIRSLRFVFSAMLGRSSTRMEVSADKQLVDRDMSDLAVIRLQNGLSWRLIRFHPSKFSSTEAADEAATAGKYLTSSRLVLRFSAEENSSMNDFAQTAMAFVEMAHRIVWCSASTVDAHVRPRSRILHPIWQWDGVRLVGWIGTTPTATKRAHLNASPYMSLNYWSPSHDTCVAECRATWALNIDRTMVRDLFLNTPEPLGYNPRIIPAWESPTCDAFAVIRLEPWRLRVLPGTALMRQGGELLNGENAYEKANCLFTRVFCFVAVRLLQTREAGPAGNRNRSEQICPRQYFLRGFVLPPHQDAGIRRV